MCKCLRNEHYLSYGVRSLQWARYVCPATCVCLRDVLLWGWIWGGLSAWQPPLGALVCVSGLCSGFMMSGRESRECRWQEWEREKGREGGRCVVALIWSAILVSTNQGLPVPGGAWVHLPKYPCTTHTHTHIHTHTHTHRNITHTCTLPSNPTGSLRSPHFLHTEYCRSILHVCFCPLTPHHVSLSVCLAPRTPKLAIK